MISARAGKTFTSWVRNTTTSPSTCFPDTEGKACDVCALMSQQARFSGSPRARHSLTGQGHELVYKRPEQLAAKPHQMQQRGCDSKTNPYKLNLVAVHGRRVTSFDGWVNDPDQQSGSPRLRERPHRPGPTWQMRCVFKQAERVS